MRMTIQLATATRASVKPAARSAPAARLQASSRFRAYHDGRASASGAGATPAAPQDVVHALGPKRRPFELDTSDLRGKVHRRADDALDVRERRFDATGGIFGRDRAQWPDAVAVTLCHVGTSATDDPLDVIDGDDVRVVVDAEHWSTALVRNMRVCDATSRREQRLQPMDAGIPDIRDVRQQDRQIYPNGLQGVRLPVHR